MGSPRLKAVVLSDNEREQLSCLASRRQTPQGLAERAQIVLAVSKGAVAWRSESVSACIPRPCASGGTISPSIGWRVCATSHAPARRERPTMTGSLSPSRAALVNPGRRPSPEATRSRVDAGEHGGRLIEPGAGPFNAECGRTSLWLRCQLANTARACQSEVNRVSFRHSSRRRPMKLSANAFCCGLPGSM